MFVDSFGNQKKSAEVFEELASYGTHLKLEEVNTNERIVRGLYEALSRRDVHCISKLVAADLEWWFHGPPTEDHLMRLLTGAASCDSFSFETVRYFSQGSKVIVEGKHCLRRDVYWVLVWTVNHRRITQLREYFNTAVMVADLQPSKASAELVQSHP